MATVLKHQYALSDAFSMQVFQVLIGSGHGLTASAAIAVAAFLQSCELSDASLARSSTCARLGIVKYARYIDNLLFIVKAPDRIEPLLAHLRSTITPYTGKDEEIGLHQFDFLDSQFVFRRYSTHSELVQSPILKLDSNFLPLSSAQPAAVHVSWPVAYVRTIWHRSHNLRTFDEYKAQFLAALCSQYWDEELIMHIESVTRYHRPPLSSQTSTRIVVARELPEVHWLTLPYHPVWESRPYIAAAVAQH